MIATPSDCLEGLAFLAEGADAGFFLVDPSMAVVLVCLGTIIGILIAWRFFQ